MMCREGMQQDDRGPAAHDLVFEFGIAAAHPHGSIETWIRRPSGCPRGLYIPPSAKGPQMWGTRLELDEGGSPIAAFTAILLRVRYVDAAGGHRDRLRLFRDNDPGHHVSDETDAGED